MKIPKSIQHATHPPRNHTKARKYPESSLWATAHNAELGSLDYNKDVIWNIRKPPSDCKLVTLPMTYRYKLDDAGAIAESKAGYAVPGEKMLPHEHYGPNKVKTYVARTQTVRILLSLAASRNLHVENFLAASP